MFTILFSGARIGKDEGVAPHQCHLISAYLTGKSEGQVGFCFGFGKQLQGGLAAWTEFYIISSPAWSESGDGAFLTRRWRKVPWNSDDKQPHVGPSWLVYGICLALYWKCPTWPAVPWTLSASIGWARQLKSSAEDQAIMEDGGELKAWDTIARYMQSPLKNDSDERGWKYWLLPGILYSHLHNRRLDDSAFKCVWSSWWKSQ